MLLLCKLTVSIRYHVIADFEIYKPSFFMKCTFAFVWKLKDSLMKSAHPHNCRPILVLCDFSNEFHASLGTIDVKGSNPDSIKKMFDKIIEEYGTCDVLVNNAGITKDGLVMRMKPEQWQSVIDINLSGVFYTTQAFFKIASKKRTGRVINISSVVGQIGNPGQANYAAAKGGVIGLTMSNAKEFSGRGVTVNCLCPGFIETDMTAKLSDEYLEEVSKGIPLGRLGKPEEVAGMTRFLAIDPAADYITGHCFNVDGGIAMGA
mmetsp:Transcript_5576/g.10076  ORF Transcript_5576/g.10076 Transcript_5576/m.10076 type:complete len:262 (-) Transcript_5576:114-899(-)